MIAKPSSYPYDGSLPAELDKVEVKAQSVFALNRLAQPVLALTFALLH
jgi:hypothetical protein